jgi:hypothetical protein
MLRNDKWAITIEISVFMLVKNKQTTAVEMSIYIQAEKF